MHLIAHVLGIDTQSSYFYDFWSGVGTQLTVVLSAAGLYRKHQCHRAWCARIGKHVVDGTPWCTKHHPCSHV